MIWDETLSTSIDPLNMSSLSSAHRTELHIPIRRDPRSFEQRERDSLCEMQRFMERDDWASRAGEDWFCEMRRDMERRRAAWEHDVSRVRNDFFHLQPALGSGTGSSFTSQSSSTRSTSMGTGHPMTTSTTSSSSSTRSEGGLTTTSGASNLDHKITYERGQDGQVRMQMRFDVGAFTPEDVRVVTHDSTLTVSARREERSANSCSSREFSRSIDLPANVDAGALQCNLTKDGVLMLEAPIRSPEYPAIAAPPGLLGASSITPVLVRSGGLEMAAKSGTSVRTIDGQKRLHLQVPIGTDYLPEEINVKAEQRKVFISARHEEKSANQSSFREFSKEYEMPESVNPALVTAKLQDGVLLVEAPL